MCDNFYLFSIIHIGQGSKNRTCTTTLRRWDDTISLYPGFHYSFDELCHFFLCHRMLHFRTSEFIKDCLFLTFLFLTVMFLNPSLIPTPIWQFRMHIFSTRVAMNIDCSTCHIEMHYP